MSQDVATARILNSWTATRGDGTPSGILRLPALTRSLDAEKTIYVERYGIGVAPALSKTGSSEFWFRTILREISTDDCILHCVIAIGALQYVFDQKHCGSAGSCHDQVAMERAQSSVHYERALKSMNLAISLMKVQLQHRNDQTSRRAILITSILFIVFELMHGDPDIADEVAAKAMMALHGMLPLYCPDRASRERIGRDMDDEGIEEASWLLPRLSAMRGGTSGLPLDSVSAPFSWEGDSCLRGLAATIKCPGQDAPHEVFMKTWDRFLTVQMVWTARIDISVVAEAERCVLAEQHRTVMGMAADWGRHIRKRIEIETERTRRLLLRVTLFFSCASRIYLKHALQPLNKTWEDDADDTMGVLDVAEQILDQSDHESSLLLFNDKILPSIPNLLTRCPVQRVRARGLRIIARTLAAMGCEPLGSHQRRSNSHPAPPRNQWLEWWWSNALPETSDWHAIVASTPPTQGSNSPCSDRESSDNGHDASPHMKDVAYHELASQVRIGSPSSRRSSSIEGDGDGGARQFSESESVRGEKLILCAIAKCVI